MIIELSTGKYLHTAYSITNIPEEMTTLDNEWSLTSQDGMDYIGTFIDGSSTESTDPNDYAWEELIDEDLDDIDEDGDIPVDDFQTQIDKLQDQVTVNQDNIRSINASIENVQTNVASNSELSSATADIANATNQHFWTDTNGVHVSNEEANAEGDRNTLFNSIGMIFRKGANYLTAILAGGASGTDPKGLAIYDGTGNNPENIVASFTDGGAVIGYSNEAHFEIGTNKIGGKLGAYNEYFAVGNKKDVSTTYTFIGDGSTTAFAIYYPSEQPVVTIDGIATTAFTYTDTTLTFSTAPSDGSTVLITYATSLNSPYFTVGGRTGQIGAFSSTLGGGLTASGLYSVGEGLLSDATGFASHAEGLDTSANGSYSHSEGNTTVASGIASHAEGYGTNATGSHAHSEGFGTTASNNSAHAEGFNTSATGGYSHSEGSNTTASGGFSHAEGSYTVASGGEAHAQNYYTIADRLYQTAIGKFNTAHNTNNAFVIGNGTADDARSDCFEVDFNGNVDASGNISSNGNVSATGNISADGNITADGDITANNHVIGIVETGTTSNNWDYRLWSDGTYEAWRSHGFTGMALTSSSAGTYYGNGTTLGVPIFPNNGNTGVLQCLCSANGAFSHSSGVYLYQVLHSSATTATADMTFQFRAHASTSNAACGIDIYLKGTYA